MIPISPLCNYYCNLMINVLIIKFKLKIEEWIVRRRIDLLQIGAVV